MLDASQDEELVEVHIQLAKELFTVNQEEATINAQKALDLASALDFQLGQINALKIIGSGYSVKNQNDTALVILEKSMSLAKEHHKGEVAGIVMTLVRIYFNQYQYQEVVRILSEEILSLEDEFVTPDVRVVALFNLSSARGLLNQIDQQEAILVDALEIAKENRLAYKVAQIYGSLGLLEFDRVNFSLAKGYFEKSLSVVEFLGDAPMVSTILYQLGQVNSRMGDYKLAMQRLDSSLLVFSSSKVDTLLVLSEKAKVFFDSNRFDEARLLLDSIDSHFSADAPQLVLKDIFELKYKIAEINKDYQEAYFSMNKWSQVKDTLEANINRQESRMLNKRFDFQRLKNEAEIEKKNREIAQLNLKRKNILIVGLLLLVFSLSIILWLNRTRLEQKLSIAEKNQQLMEKEIELGNRRIHEQEETINAIKDQLETRENLISSDKELIKILESHPLQSHHWMDFRKRFDQRFPMFVSGLKEFSLTANELRLASLIRLGLATKEMAAILAITPKSVNKAKSRLAQKTQKNSVPDLESFLNSIS